MCLLSGSWAGRCAASSRRAARDGRGLPQGRRARRATARTCRFFASLKMLAMLAEGRTAPPPRQRLERLPRYGRFSGVHLWPVLGVHRGKPKNQRKKATPNVAIIRGPCFSSTSRTHVVRALLMSHQASDARVRRPACVERALSDSRNDVISSARVSAEYVYVASDQAANA